MRRLTLGLCVFFIFTIPWENIVEFAGVGRISKVVGLGVAVLWMASVVWTGRIRKPRLFHVAVFLFVLWNTLSYYWTRDPLETVQRFFTYVQLFVLVYLLWDLITTLEDLQVMLEAYVLGAWVTVTSLIVGYLTHGPVGYKQRFTTGTFQLDDVSLILSLGIPAAWYLTIQGQSRFIKALRWVNFGYLPAATLAIMLTGSRTAMVSVGAAALYVIGSLPRLSLRSRVLVVTSLAVLLLVLTPLLVPERTLERLESTGQEATEGTLSGRLAIWREAYAAFRTHPLLGVGSGAFRGVDTHKVTHNFVLRFLSELGLVGLLLFLTLFVLAALHVPPQTGGLFGLWASILATWLIGASLYNFEEKKQTWFFFSMVVVGWGLIKPEPAPPPAVAEPVER